MKKSRSFRRLCVFCGSSSGVREEYAQQARAVGQLLAREEIDLVYGGGASGLMGELANATLEAGGNAIGIIPDALVARERAHPALTELHVVDSMHDRKAMMAALSDGFMALPGGVGTLEELFEVVSWLQLGLHKKPIGLLNVEGYWDRLLDLVEHARDEGFIPQRPLDLLVAESRPEALLDALRAYQPPAGLAQWITANET